MRSLRIALLAAVLAMAGCASQPKEPVVNDDMHQVSATVEGVDHATRMLILRGPNGLTSVEVGPEVRNFDQIKVGDKVQATYYTGVAAQLRKKGEPASAPTDEVQTVRAEPGARPGVAVGHNISTTVKIESVDMSTHTVTFKRPDGVVRVVAVKAPQMQKFIGTLRPGDEVDVTYTEAVAVEVVPGK